MLVAFRSLLAATALLAVFATTAAAQDPACDRTWNGTSGTYHDGSKWSGGAIPTGNERGCLPAGSYTVTLTAGHSPKGLTVGAGVTLVIKQFQYLDARTASFINHGTVRLESSAALYGPLVNDGTVEDTGTIPPGNNRPTIIGTVTNSGTIRANEGLNLQRDDGTFASTGRLETATATALLNGTGYPTGTWTIGGAVANPGLMQFQGGTMRVRAVTAQTGNLFRTYDAKLDLDGASAASVETNNTVDLVTDIPAGVTVTAMGRSNEANLRLDGNRTNNGTLVMDSADVNRIAVVSAVSGIPKLTNAGTLRLKATVSNDRRFDVPFANTGTLTVDSGARLYLNGDGDLRASTTSGTFTVNGNFWNPRVNNTLTQTAGTMTVTGSMLFQGGQYIHQGGTVAGEITIGDNATLDPSGPGLANYRVNGIATLSGDVNANATVTVESDGLSYANLYLTADRTVAGHLVLTAKGAFAQDATIAGLNGVNTRLAVSGTVDALYGTFGGTRNFNNVPLTVTATGQFNVGTNAKVFMNGNGTSASTLAGAVNVAAGGLLLFRITSQTITQTAGTINATGTFNVEGNTFVHQGGTVNGVVTVSSSNVRGVLDASGPGTAAYVIVNAVNLTGDVSADARIDVGTAANSGTLYVRDRDLTNRGTIQVGPETSAWPSGLSDEGQPYTLTNAGTLTTGKGGGRNLDVRLVNSGTINLNEGTSGISSITDKPLVTNSGTVNIRSWFNSWRGYTQTGGLTDLYDGSFGSPRTPADIQLLGGRLRGTGIVYGPVTNAATVEVGRAGSYGKLQIKDVVDQIVRVAASYTQTPVGRLAVDIGSKTTFDQLTVDGPATLDGALDVSTAAGYTPTPTTDTFRVLLSETRTKEFANLTGGRFYTLSHDATGAVLTGRVAPPPTAELTIGDASAVEGAGPLTFTVTLSKASTDPVTVDWTTEDDTALAGADYTAASGTLTFAPGATTQTLTVPVVNDQVVEGVKQLLLRLRHPVNATLDVATGIGRIDPDDVGITNTAPTSVGVAGNATMVITGGGFGPTTTAKLIRAGQADRAGTITAGPENGSKFSVRFDMRGAAQGQWSLVVTTPTGSASTPITVQSGASALYASLSVPSSLRYGWVGQAVLSLRNAGSNDVSLDGVRFSGADLELRAVGSTAFGPRLTLAADQLGDAAVIPALSTRTVVVEVRSTTQVGHALMTLDAEILPTDHRPVTAVGSDPDPGSGSITGHVTSAAGAPVRGLRVTAFDGAHSASATTDGSGAYTLKPLKPGTYRVEAGGAKGSAAVNENAQTVNLVTGVAELSGSVGKGDATVTLLRAGAAVGQVAADATGGFRFRVTQPGAYTLVADSPTGGRASRAVTVIAGSDQPGLDLTFGTRTLTVTTTPGASVSVYPAGEAAAPSLRTATGTTLTIPGMPAGALTVEARAAGKATARTTTSTNAVTVTPTTGGTLSGKVTEAGTAVQDALVIASSGGESRSALTGADGRYTFTGLTGAQDVWVFAPGTTPRVSRAVALGSTTADAAVVTTGSTLDVRVGAGAVGRLIEVVDPATGVTIAARGTVGPDAVAHFEPLPAGTFTVRGAGAGARTVTLGAAKLPHAAAEQDVTLDDDGYPVVADPEHDPAYDEYTSPFSGLKAPQLNEKDRLGWDQVQADYPGPCPTADRLIDTIRLKQRAKLVAFSAWVEAWDAVDSQNRADIEKLMTISAQFTANTFLALASLGKVPPGIGSTASGALGNLANYMGTVVQQQQGLLDPLTAVDHAQYFKDVVDTLAGLNSEYGGSGTELGYLSTTINILRGLIDISDQAREFSSEVAARGGGYLEAQGRYEQILREINDLLNQYAEAKKHCPELVDRGPKPPISSGGRIENITSNDPNELIGPAGAGAQKWIPRAQVLGYTIRFENLGPGSTIPPGQQPASAPATIVKVVTTLADSIDIEQVTLGGVGWGAVELAVPAGLTTYHKDVPLTDGDIVRVDGALNKGARTITWTLKTIDPLTGEVDGSPTAGFLPPEDGTRRGQGHVDYRAGTPGSGAQGTAISAKATITFDVNTPIETNTHTNTVDGVAPAATLTLGAPACNGALPVSWTGTDDGSGVATYDVEVSTDSGLSWKSWLADTAATSGSFPGTPGQSYAFRVVARDAVGNTETAPLTPDATIALGPCDLTPPRTTASLPDGAVGGWYGGPVDVRLNAVDAPGGSGVATLRYAGKQVAAATATERVAAEGTTDFVFSAVDAKGNAEADAHLPVRIDTTAPTISGTDGASYALGQAAASDATCADAGSGVATCSVPVPDTSAAGTFSYAVNATDKLGHTASRTFSYTVTAPQTLPAPPANPNPPATPPPGPSFAAKPVTVKLGKVTRTTAVITLTSKEAFALTGKATLLTTAKKPKAVSKAASFALAKGKSGKLTLKLKPSLKKGFKTKLVLRLELRAGNATKVVNVTLTLRAK